MWNTQNFVHLLTALSLSPSPEAPSHYDLSPSALGASFITTDAKSCTPDDPRWQFSPSPPVLAPQPRPFDRKISSVYRYRQQQGVNLGSWFVQEGWMEPSLFTCASGARSGELDLASGFGSNQTLARLALENHWDTFVTEQDFSYLATIGINTVRLPLGYWSLGPDGGWMDGTPFENVKNVYTGSWPRILRAIGMAERYGIGVLVDLHGAPGSQNGQPHSGTSDGKIGLFDSACYMNRTTEALSFLTRQLVNRNNVIGIQLLNEPHNDPRLPDFYTKTLNILRGISPDAARFPFYIHDAFNLGQYGRFVANRTDFVVEDHHSYFVYTPSDQLESAASHTVDVDSNVLKSLTSTAVSERRNMVIGEWSCALAPQSLAQETHPSDAQRAFCEGQMSTYTASSAGWAFWSYTKEDCDDDGGWCFRQAVGTNLPSTFYSFPLSKPNDTAATLLRTSMVSGSSSNNNLDSVLSCITPSSTPGLPSVITNKVDSNLTLTNSSMTAIDRYTPRIAGALMIPLGNPSFLQQRRMSAESNPLKRRSGTSGHLPRYFFGHGRPHHRIIQNRQQRQLQFSESIGSGLSTLPSNPFAHMTPAERSIARGYADGFSTAKVFASNGLSKLGFVGQYISDSYEELLQDDSNGMSKEDPERGLYSTWFLKGLRDAEAQITAFLNGQPVVYPGS